MERSIFTQDDLYIIEAELRARSQFDVDEAYLFISIFDISPANEIKSPTLSCYP